VAIRAARTEDADLVIVIRSDEVDALQDGRAISVVSSTARAERPNGLTRRQTEIVSLMADGLTDAQVGEALHISVKTVKTQLQFAFDRANVPHRRGALIARALREGWIE
jgi:DNA-binding NarL/FixJ family response regulator